MRRGDAIDDVRVLILLINFLLYSEEIVQYLSIVFPKRKNRDENEKTDRSYSISHILIDLGIFPSKCFGFLLSISLKEFTGHHLIFSSFIFSCRDLNLDINPVLSIPITATGLYIFYRTFNTVIKRTLILGKIQ